jgi:hypothetical protein
MKLVNCTVCLPSKEIYLEKKYLWMAQKDFLIFLLLIKKEGKTRRSELQEMKWVLKHDFAAIHKARFIEEKKIVLEWFKFSCDSSHAHN